MVRAKYWSRVLFLISPFLVSQKSNLKLLLYFNDRSSSDSLLMLVRPSLVYSRIMRILYLSASLGRSSFFVLVTVIV